MPRRISFLVALFVAIAGGPRPSQADDLQIGLPDDIKFAARVDVTALQKSVVGGRLFAMAKAQVLEKLADKAEGKGLSPEKIGEVLGFDPFEEVQNVIVATADFEVPEKSLIVVIQLRKTTGNLEGLLLAIPGYKSEDHNGHQIHSAMPDDATPFYCAFYADAAGHRNVVVAAQRAAIEHVLDALDANSAGSAPARAVTLDGDDGSIATVDLFELPTEMIGEDGPPANIAKIIRSLSVRISEGDDKVNIAASIVADADKQAEQLEQMTKGLSAMVGLAASADDADEDLKMVQKILTDLAVTRSGAAIDLKLSVPAADVQKLIEDNLIKD